MKVKSLKRDKVNIVTLGCSKNTVDSENIMTQLRGNGIRVTHESEKGDANIVIVNTCGFIDLAKEESVNTILDYAALKKEGGIDKLYVTGCLSQRYKLQLEEDIPEVDAFFGVMELPGLLAKFNADYKQELVGERAISTLPHFAYLKISEGCNRTCSFCAIPLMRGKHISQPIESLVQQARNFAKRGVKELILIAQELTYYGLDLYKKRALNELLAELNAVEGIEWIRLHYAYPSKFPVEVFDAMRELPKVCNYLDLPLQHASDEVLKRMRRQITQEETRALIQLAREKSPGIAIRTTFLVGFPGETEAEFEELCRFVEEMEFDRVGAFKYSHEEGTSAYDLEDDVPEEVKEYRAQRLLEVQRPISLGKNQAKVGKKLKVLFDRKEGGYYVGRTEQDSPEVDNEVLVKADNKTHIRIGDFAEVKIISCSDYDLFAEVETSKVPIYEMVTVN